MVPIKTVFQRLFITVVRPRMTSWRMQSGDATLSFTAIINPEKKKKKNAKSKNDVVNKSLLMFFFFQKT